MKTKLISVFLICLVMMLYTVPANAQPEKLDNPSQDMLIKSEVETAVSMLQALFNKHQEGEMTFEQSKNLGAHLLRELRYGTEGYFWADTEEGVNVVLYGRKDVEGKNRMDAKDFKGNFYVRQFITTGKSGGGFVNYMFTKKGASKQEVKRSYVLLFEPFGWVIGTGYYH